MLVDHQLTDNDQFTAGELDVGQTYYNKEYGVVLAVELNTQRGYQGIVQLTTGKVYLINYESVLRFTTYPMKAVRC